MRIDKMFKNIKTGEIYYAMYDVINCTNKNYGQKMIVFSNGTGKFVREEKEFYQKFAEI